MMNLENIILEDVTLETFLLAPCCASSSTYFIQLFLYGFRYYQPSVLSNLVVSLVRGPCPSSSNAPASEKATSVESKERTMDGQKGDNATPRSLPTLVGEQQSAAWLPSAFQLQLPFLLGSQLRTYVRVRTMSSGGCG